MGFSICSRSEPAASWLSNTSINRMASGRRLCRTLDGATHVEPLYRIVGTRPGDLPLLPAIERAAAALLTGHAPGSVLSETTSEEESREAQAAGRLFVALAGDE